MDLNVLEGHYYLQQTNEIAIIFVILILMIIGKIVANDLKLLQKIDLGNNMVLCLTDML